MTIITNKISYLFLFIFIFFTTDLIQSQNKDFITLILKNNLKSDYIINPFVNCVEYDNIITSINKDTLIFKTSYILDDTILFNNGTLGYNFRNKVQPNEQIEKTIFINSLLFINKIEVIKIEIRDKNEVYNYFFRHKRRKIYTFYKIEIGSSILD